jgi:hypothetical protein
MTTGAPYRANGFLRTFLVMGAVLATVVLGLLALRHRSAENYQALGRPAIAQLDTLYHERPRVIHELESLDLRMDSLEVQVGRHLERHGPVP